MIACLDPGPGCGFFNGDYVCTQHVPADSCVSFASGGVACVTGSPDVPKDAMGDPLLPDGTVSRGTQDVDYYAPESVAAAATPATTSSGVGGSAEGAPGADGSAPPADGGGGGGTGDITVDVDIEGECPEGETCEGTLPGATPGDFEEVCTFAECTQGFYERVLDAPIVASVLDAGASMPTGTCPNWSLEAFEHDYSLSAPMCSIWEDVSPVLSAIFLVVWAWVATRIVLSA